jgi:hypothetical protein
VVIGQGGPANCALFVRKNLRQDAEAALFAPEDQIPFYATPGARKRGRPEGEGWVLYQISLIMTHVPICVCQWT